MMELLLAHQDDAQVKVTCDGHFSHLFDVRPLRLIPEREHERLVEDPVEYGRALYTALFATGSRTRQALEETPERIVLIAVDDDVDAIPWEYLHGPDGFLVQECHFVRGLPIEQRGKPPTLETGLNIVAVPSNPLSDQIKPLDVETEWLNLRDSVSSLPFALTLERTRPPTIRQLRNAVAGQRQQVVHFMGHGGQTQAGAVLCFEKDDGDLDLVKAKEVATRLRGSTFLITLNACVTASPGSTTFSNLAAALVRQRIPYALGMRLSIYDDDARIFARAFYDDLARGTPVEEALLQARLTLASESSRPWVIGVPVLYTSLLTPASGFIRQEGTPVVQNQKSPLEVSALPRAEGTFQGRVADLRRLGALLTGDRRPRIITIHGGGGQGKTALAREVAERFAWAWPGGVWSATLENLPDRTLFAAELARFLGLNPQEIADPNEVERRILAQLATKRILIVLDNAETLVDAVEADNEGAQQLAQLLQQLPSTSVSLLITSRSLLGWLGEVEHELGGLTAKEGAQLFIQSSPQRQDAIEAALARELSNKVEGHPLSLRLLGGAFNFSAIPLSTFVQQCEKQLINAENKYLEHEHRHRKLYACLETSVRYLNSELRDVLSCLWIFHAPFLPQIAVAILNPDTKETAETPSILRTHLHNLRLRGLLTLRQINTRDGKLDFFYLLPTTRPYIEQHMQSTSKRQDILDYFGAAYAGLIHLVYAEIDRTSLVSALIEQSEVDLERGMAYVAGIEQARYKIYWAAILHRLGATLQRSLKLLEEALNELQGREQGLVLAALNTMATVYGERGELRQALQLYEQTLPIRHEIGDRNGEATTLNNMGTIYGNIGEHERALQFYEQALPIIREVNDRAGEVTTLNNIAAAYGERGDSERALQLYEQVLPITREIGNRNGEAAALNNMALVYGDRGDSEHALQFYEQALPITREIGNRNGEVATLNNMAAIYRNIGDSERALQLYEQALPITRQIGNRTSEAAILSNTAVIYRERREPECALQLYEQALPIMSEVGDRAGEAATLNNMALAYGDAGKPERALQLYEQTLIITREIDNRASEAAILSNIAMLLYQDLKRREEAVFNMEQAIQVLEQMDFAQTAAGQTREQLSEILGIMRNRMPPTNMATTLPTETIQTIITNTVSVMTHLPEHRDTWRETLENAFQDAQQQGPDWQIEVELFTALLTLLDGKLPVLLADHPYGPVMISIQERIAAGQLPNAEEDKKQGKKMD